MCDSYVCRNKATVVFTWVACTISPSLWLLSFPVATGFVHSLLQVIPINGSGDKMCLSFVTHVSKIETLVYISATRSLENGWETLLYPLKTSTGSMLTTESKLLSEAHFKSFTVLSQFLNLSRFNLRHDLTTNKSSVLKCTFTRCRISFIVTLSSTNLSVHKRRKSGMQSSWFLGVGAFR
jgi:hypothetical protein